jgi:preprotein translocase subunit SecG
MREDVRPGQSADGEQNKTSGEQDYLTVAVHKKNVRKTTFLLAVLFGIGLLCLWFMIKKSVPATAVAAAGVEESQFEKAVSQLIGAKSEIFNRMDEVVSKFYEFSDVQQIKVNELVKNPFELEIFLGNAGKNTDKDNDFDIELLRQQQMKEQAGEMQLLSIMQSSADKGNCCMIDDKILYEGDKIRGFEVRKISDKTVSLESQGVEIVLKLAE